MPEIALTDDEREQLTGIFAGLYLVTDAGATGRRVLLENAQLGIFVPGLVLDGPAGVFAADVVGRLLAYGAFPDSPGHHVLGALLRYVLNTQADLPAAQAQFLADLVVKYGLIADSTYLDELCRRYGVSRPAVSPSKEDPTAARKQALKERLAALRSQGTAPERAATAASHYFFYVSTDKLNALETAAGTAAVPDPTVQLALAAIGDGPIRSTEFQERCRRLRALLVRLGQDTPVQQLTDASVVDSVKVGPAYAQLSLRLQEQKGSITILHGQIGSLQVRLACSQENFRDYEPLTRQVAMTSTNHWFFGLGSAYSFLTHFWILSVDAGTGTILGSPVYLALPVGVL